MVTLPPETCMVMDYKDTKTYNVKSFGIPQRTLPTERVSWIVVLHI